MTGIEKLFVAGCIAGALLTSPSFAQETCAPRDQALVILQEQYGERTVGRGLVTVENNTVVVEVFASEEHGTFSIVVTRADGISCLLVSGDTYQIVREALGPNL